MRNQTNLENGLTNDEAKRLQEKFGKNELTKEKNETFIKKVLHIMCEPMFALLILAAVIYFILGEPRDGAIMLIFVIGIIAIDVIQEWKTDKTLNALKELSAPTVEVIRNNERQLISSVDLVPGDIMIIMEGVKIPADGFVLKCNDLSIDESSLTGESENVWKIVESEKNENIDYWKKDYCYAGTLVTKGMGYIEVDKIGLETEYGKISKDISEAPTEDTPLQKQTGKLVKTCAIIAGILFILVSVFTYLDISDHPFKDRLIESILSGITLAMAMIPEEFPVVLTVFLSMGAWRLAKKNSLVRKLPSVETLGAVSVLCTDKTGTITLNQMSVKEVWSIEENNHELIKIMGMACETEAYDPMEHAMLEYCEKQEVSKEELFSGEFLTEYAFTDKLKMMGHVWKKDNKIIIASKGAPESILRISDITEIQKNKIEEQINSMSNEGMRVIACGVMEVSEEKDIPSEIIDCKLRFSGLIGLIDPPRESVKEDIERCNKAGIRVVMITGDNGVTAKAIAKQVGIRNCDNIITGEELDQMTDEELKEKIKTVNIFSRVIPEHKMKIVKAFKENDEIVAMTGDGVNDAAALRYADIGIAMGKRGSEVSREAADLILLDDNFSTILDTVKDGRRIYENIRKAIGYIFTIHIPIAFASLLAPLLRISPDNLFLLPLHVVLLELVIDPTCSIVLERQPAERNIMNKKPRKTDENILNKFILAKSILQGIAIFIASFGTYYYILSQNVNNVEIARTMGFAVIILANLLLVQVNSSEKDHMFKCIKKLVKDKVILVINIITILALVAIIYTPISMYLKLTALSLQQVLIVVGISMVSVLWYEIIKIVNNLKKDK